MLILDLWRISFHAVVVFGLGKNLLFKSILGRCVPIAEEAAIFVNKRLELLTPSDSCAQNTPYYLTSDIVRRPQNLKEKNLPPSFEITW